METSIDEINGVTSTIPEGVTIYVNTVCPEDGLTINACGRDGNIILYISRTPDPGPASYDETIEINEGKCDNTFIECNEGSRRRRQSETIYMAIEGVYRRG